MTKLGIVDAAARAQDAWARINDRATAITLYRDGKALSAQTVRVEFSAVFRETSGGAGEMGVSTAIVFGVRGHPTITNTDIQRGDTFEGEDTLYTVLAVVALPGEVQARCEAVS